MKKLKILCISIMVFSLNFYAGQAIAVEPSDPMLKLIEILYEKGSLTEEEYQLMLQAAQQRQSPNLTVDTTDLDRIIEEKVTAANADRPKITTKGKFSIQSADGQFEWRLGGRVQTDFALYNDETDSAGNPVPLADFGSEVRRARLYMQGKLWDDWGLKMQYDFASTTIKDAYMQYTGFADTDIKIGHFKEQFSISELTSSKYITFMERPSPIVTFAPSRNLGIGVTHTVGDKATLSGGFFSQGLDNGSGADTASYAFTGRATFVPINSERRVLHLGSALSWRKSDGSDSFLLKDRFETHVTNTRLIDTGTISGSDSILKSNLEVAAIFNRLSVQGEYLRADIDRDSGFGNDLDFDGFYALGSFFLTEDARRYSFGNGSFSAVKPSNPVGRGGIGAWEVALRYSATDLRDGTVDGGDQDILGIALNVYPIDNIRFQLNYNTVLSHDGGKFDGAEPSVLQGRAQVFW